MNENELNELLIKIVGAVSLHYCQTLDANGMDRDAINERLHYVVPELDRWRANTLADLRRGTKEPAPSARAPSVH
jgi:hypothetical protein